MSYLVSIDGLSGSGKSTALKAVVAALRKHHLRVHAYHDRLGEPHAAMLDTAQHGLDLSPLARLYFMLALRRQVIDGAILPSLAHDDITITDRYYPSTIAYQAYGQKLDPSLVTRLALEAAAGAIPQRVFYIDVPARVALNRMAERGGTLQVFDAEHEAFHERVRQGYLAQARHNRTFTIIDGTLPKERVARTILSRILADLARHAAKGNDTAV